MSLQRFILHNTAAASCLCSRIRQLLNNRPPGTKHELENGNDEPLSRDLDFVQSTPLGWKFITLLRPDEGRQSKNMRGEWKGGKFAKSPH
jgi:hypothetical protein